MAKVKKNSGRKTYFICLAIYSIILIAASVFALTVVWKYAEEYENSQPERVVKAYVANLSENLWDESIAATIANMPHELQSDEECAEYVKELLSSGISYARTASADAAANLISYELRCNNNVFAKLSLAEDQSYADDVRFGMLPWRVEREEFDFNALYSSFSVVVPSTYEVYLNDTKLGEEYIVEDGIHYDVLEDYYEKFDGLPTKVKYQFDNIIGTLESKIIDDMGNEVTIDESQDDSQFIRQCTEEQVASLANYTANFLDRYLRFISGVGDPFYAYEQLVPYMELNSELDNYLKVAMDGLSWSHTSAVRVDASSLNGAVELGDGYYIIDVSVTTTVVYPGKGETQGDQSMKIVVKDTAGEIRAVSLDKY